MYRDFQDIIKRAAGQKNPPWICILKAEDKKNLEVAQEAVRKNLARFILVGDRERIEREMGRRPDPQRIRLIEAATTQEMVHIGLDLVQKKEAAVLMKGLISSKELMGAALSRKDLFFSPILSHLAAFDISTYPRVLFMSDGGINVQPDLMKKKEILQNAIDALHRLGISRPKVALLAAVETVDLNMSATIDAALLKTMAERRQIKGACIDGPLALDIAIQKEAKALKGIGGEVAGEADLLLVPNIESGNIMGKTISHLTGGTMAGLVLGYRVPIILTSRSDTAYGRLASIALAVLEVEKK